MIYIGWIGIGNCGQKTSNVQACTYDRVSFSDKICINAS